MAAGGCRCIVAAWNQDNQPLRRFPGEVSEARRRLGGGGAGAARKCKFPPDHRQYGKRAHANSKPALKVFGAISTHMDTSIVTPLSAEDLFEMLLPAPPTTAVFDCDGTLWSKDTGYEFMLWSIAEGLVSRSASDWIDARYRLYRAGQVSEIAMCGEMVQLYEGLREAEIRKAAATFFSTQMTASDFPVMRRLVSALRSAGSELWAVSSTNNWVIEEGLRDYGFAPDRILAAQVEVVDGRITSKLIDVPSDERKALALERAGVPAPDAVFGNSAHDAAMLAMARRPFAVNPSPELLVLAGRNGWPVFYPSLE